MTTLFVPGAVRGQGSMRLVQGRPLYPQTVVQWRNLLVLAMNDWWGDHPPIDTAARVFLDAAFGRPQNHYRTGKHAGELKQDAPQTWCVGRVDADKVARCALDALTVAGVLRDDSLVVALSVRKRWATLRERPGLHITVEMAREPTGTTA